jgi:transcriptional regulator with XRE-family HTH domain
MIRNRLQELLNETHTSQRQLARGISTRPNTISDIASNKIHRYDMQIIEKICDYFAIDIAFFFYKTDEPYTDENG